MSGVIMVLKKPTEVEVRERISLLQNEHQPPAFFADTYGVRKALVEPLLALVATWSSRRQQSVTKAAKTSRYAFEEFLAENDLFAPHQAAYRIGVEPRCLTALLKQAPKLFGIPKDNVETSGLVKRSFITGLHKYFPGLRSRTFSTHSAKWFAVHEALRAEHVEIDAAYDPAAELLGRKELAADIDILTCGPLGLRHTAWLDFGKPFFLEPDKTSVVLLVAFRALGAKGFF